IVPNPAESACIGDDVFVFPFATDNTSDSGTPTTCSNSGKDQWFTWTATSLGLQFNALHPGEPGMAIFSNCGDASDGIEIDCAFTGAGNAYLRGWEIGDELLIQVYDEIFQTSDVAFCLTEINPPANNDCINAIELPVDISATCVSSIRGSNSLASPSGEMPSPTCGNFAAGNDVWYRVAVPSSGKVNLEMSSAGFPNPISWAMAAYSGTCGNLSIIECSTFNGFSSLPVLDLEGQTPGSDLYIRVWESGSNSEGAFNICAFSEPCDLQITGLSPTDEGCAGANDGSISLSTNTSNPPINYSLTGPVEQNNSTGVFNALPAGAYTIIATDALDNCSLSTTVMIESGTPLVVDCAQLQDQDLDCLDDLPVPNFDLAWVTSACGSIQVAHVDTISDGLGCILDPIIVERTYTISDDQNTTTCVQVFTFESNEAPSVSCPPNTTIACDAIPSTAVTGMATASADCGIDYNLIYFDNATSGVCIQEESIERVWTVIDACGRMTECSQIIEVIDTIPPDLPTIPAVLTFQCGEEVPEAMVMITTDNCFSPIEGLPTSVQSPGDCAHDFTILRTWTFDDGCGNVSSISQQIIVKDTIPPTAPMAPVNLTLQCTTEIPPAVPLTATDNCSPDLTVMPTEQMSMGDCSNELSLLRTWTFTDECGNSATMSQSIVVKDTIPPLAPMAPANLLLQCAQEVPPAIALTASDNCSPDLTVMPTEQMSPGACANQFTLVRTWTFMDDCGNSSTAVQIIDVVDNTPPAVPSPPTDLVIQCANEIPDEIALTAIDNCGESITVLPSNVITPGDCTTRFTLTRTWTFADQCGNTSSVEQNIEVLDDMPISVIAPPDQTVNCAYNVIATPALVVVNTPCSSSYEVESIGPSLVEGTADCPEAIYQITYVATDACGRTATATQSFTIDNAAPQFVCPTDICVIDCPADVEQIWNTFNAYASQAVINASCNSQPFVYNDFHPDNFIAVDCHNNSFGILNVIEYQTVTFYATDACGRTATCTALVIVKDTQDPEIVGEPYPTIRECDDLVQSEYEAWIADNLSTLSATDACSEVAWSYHPPSPNETIWVNGFATTSVVFTASDECGSSTSRTTKFRLKNNFPPSFIDKLEEKTVTCDSTPLPFDVPNYVHSCGESTLTFVDEIITSQVPNEYSVIRTWTVTDQTGKSNTVSQTIFVVDQTAPVVLVAPDNLSITCWEEVPPASELSAMDNCSGTITAFPQDDSTPGNCANELIVLRTWTFTDLSGNTTQVQQSIVVKDEMPPTFTFIPPNLVQACGSTPQFGTPIVKDNCDGAIQLSWNDVMGGNTCNGFATRTWEATDACGNTSTASQIIEFKDQEGPVFAPLPPSQSINCDDFPPSFNAPVVEDACSEVIELNVEESYLSGGPNSCLLGEDFAFQRTWTATDACGNVSTTKQVFDVRTNTGTGLTREAPSQNDSKAEAVFELLQNQPNPFMQETTIGFILPAASTASLSLYDPAGRLVYQLKGDFEQGYNEISVSRSELGSSGTFYYRLDTPKHTATKRLIIY
ncbi:MAG: T9SS type A sorting domain-containing protein, partial [Bacteroidota bacterium]